MTSLAIQKQHIPLVDPQTGLCTVEWYKTFQQLLSRVGGPISTSNNDLQDQIDELEGQLVGFGINPPPEQIQQPGDLTPPVVPQNAADELTPPVVLLRADDDLTPPIAQLPDPEDPHGRIHALEAEIAALRQAVEALQQGPQL